MRSVIAGMNGNRVMPNELGYSKLPTAAVHAFIAADLDNIEIYLPQSNDAAPVLYRKAGADLSEPDFDRIREHGVAAVLVRTTDLATCERSLESKLDELLKNSAITAPEKVELIHRVTVNTTRELLQCALSPERTARLSQIIESTMDAVLSDPQIGAYMLKSAGHQRTLASHMQIVSTLSMMLAAEVYGEDRAALHEVGLAGLLHDLGKLSVPASILNKPARLTTEELLLIQQHPIESVRLIGEDPTVSADARKMILQHHERMDGRGYPLGIPGGELHSGSRLLTIVDCFHAMIGQRPYRTAYSVAEANRHLLTSVGKQFDKDFFECWLALCERCEVDATAHWTLPLETPAPDDAVAARHEHRTRSTRPGSVPRRRPRLQCPENTLVRCVYAGRLLNATAAPDEFAACVQDVSRGGLCIFSAHPMFRGEILHVRMRTPNDTIWLRAMVCWCRPENLNTYRVGLRFVKRISDGEIGDEVLVEALGGIAMPETTATGGDATPAADRCDDVAMGDKRNDALQRLAAIATMRTATREAQRMAVVLSMSSDVVVRERAIDVLAGINSPTTREGLLGLLTDNNPRIRERAAIAVGMAKVAEASTRLRELLQDESEAVGLRAAAALGQLDDWSGLPLVVRVLKEDGPNLRVAVRAFGDITGQRFSANREGLASARRYLKAKKREFAEKVKACMELA